MNADDDSGYFTHLHVRSGCSWGFGTAMPGEIAHAAVDLCMGAVALTDRDTLFGAPRFLAACRERGVSPIVGAEITVEGGGHLVLLVESERGYRNLCRLITSYHCSSADRRKPECPLETALEHAEGLICLTGAIPFGFAPRLVLSERSERVRIERLREAFGTDGLFVELTNDMTAGSRRRAREIREFARSRSLRIVATNEVAYLTRRDHRLHEVLSAASNLSALPPPGYRPTDQLYLKSARKMARLFEGYPDALQCVREIEGRCTDALGKPSGVHMPSVRMAGGESSEKRLVRLAVAGARRRYDREMLPEVKQRMKRELSCIVSLGFAPYFLLAREAVEVAKAEEMPVTGRGSSANSLVAHCLGVTQPEPLSNRLLFERFLHEEREDPPDIDLDFSSVGREIVREEMIRRYEHLGAAEAATVQTLSLRGAVRVAARALGHAPREINVLSRGVPTRFRDRIQTYNPTSGWKEALSEPSMRGHPLQERERYSLLLDLSWRLVGKMHQRHA